MNSYNQAALGEMCDVSIGRTPRRNDPRYWGGPHPWATIRDLNDGTLRSTAQGITDVALDEVMPEPVEPNTLLFSFKLSIGKMAFAGRRMHHNEAIAALSIRNSKVLDREFLFYALKAKALDVGANHAVLGKVLNKRKVEAIEIPVPALSEQRRIVDILNRSVKIKQLQAQAAARLRELFPALFIRIFGDPATNPMGWQVSPLGEVIRVSSGRGLSAKHMRPGDFPVYGGNGIAGYHSDFMFDEPKIVIGRVGANCGAIHLSHPKSWITDNALYVREIRRPVTTIYLEWALRMANLNQYAGKAAQPLISGSRIYPVLVMLPDKVTQRKFVQIVKAAGTSSELVMSAASVADKFTKSLMSRLLGAST